MTSLLRRPDPAPSRAAQRKQRLLELENEQRLEDAEALKFTEEQRLSLFLSFRSVKFEWSDLDGMRSVRRRYNSSCASPPPTTAHTLSTPSLPTLSLPTLSPASLPTLSSTSSPPSSSPSSLPTATPTPTPCAPQQQAFAVLTNAHLASFGKDDTIRGDPRGYDFPPPALRRVLSSSTIPSSTSTLLSPVAPAAPPGFTRSVSAPSTPASAPPTPATKTHRAGGKRRSPVKGLFTLPVTSVCTSTASAFATASTSAASASACVSPIRVPLPLLSALGAARAGGEGGQGMGAEGGEDDEDAWIDEDDDMIVPDPNDLDVDELRTPVPGDAEDALPTPNTARPGRGFDSVAYDSFDS
ncbi:hypothetical protein DFH06DRAFT_1333022 [Mycena polygramma]|nr:hypothetical protein DFH06DRAFT_1333022 [Mycena polygramma]